MEGDKSTDASAIPMKECFIQLKSLDERRSEQPKVVARPLIQLPLSENSNNWEAKYPHIEEDGHGNILGEVSCNNLAKHRTMKRKHSIKKPSVIDLTSPCAVSFETLEDKENKMNAHCALNRKEIEQKPFSQSAIPGGLPKSSAIHLPNNVNKAQRNDIGCGSKRLKIQEKEHHLLTTKSSNTNLVKPCFVALEKLENFIVTPNHADEKESTPEKTSNSTLVKDETICAEPPLPFSEVDGQHDKDEGVYTPDAVVSPDDDHVPSYGFLRHVWNRVSNWMMGN